MADKRFLCKNSQALVAPSANQLGIRTENIRTENIRTENTRTENTRTENTRTENTRTENTRTENTRTENIRTEQLPSCLALGATRSIEHVNSCTALVLQTHPLTHNISA